MKLNPDCLRAILLTVEEKCNFHTPWEYEEIIYHIRLASQSGLIQGVHYYDGGETIIVSDLTPYGHEFLANIRSDSLWKKVISKGADASLPILMELAKNIALKHFLG